MIKKISLNLLLFLSANLFAGTLTYHFSEICVSTDSSVQKRIVQKPGHPSLEYFVAKFALPVNVDQTSITLSSIPETTTTEVSGYIPPVGPITNNTDKTQIWPQGINQITGECDSIYNSEKFYPNSNVEIKSIDKLWEYTIVTVAYYPVCYNPSRNQIIKYPDCNITLSWKLNNNPLLINAPHAFINKMATRLRNIVINKDASYIETNISTSKNLMRSNKSFNAEKEGYLIVTTDTIRHYNSIAINKFKDLKEKQGYNVFIIDEDDYNNGTCVKDDNEGAVKIRTWIRNHYVSMNISYVLLLGDPNNSSSKNTRNYHASKVPQEKYANVPMMAASPYITPKFTATPDDDIHILDVCWTDFYYGELSAPSWDLDGDGYLGEIDDDGILESGTGADRCAEVSVGRFPIYYYSNYTNSKEDHNVSELEIVPFENYVDKLIKYSNESDISWRSNALLINPDIQLGNTNPPTYMYPEAVLNEIVKPADFGFHRIYDEWYFISNLGITIEPETFYATEDNVINVWNSGKYGFVNWLTHGTFFGMPKYGIVNGKPVVIDFIQIYGTRAIQIISSKRIDELSSTNPAIVFMGSCSLALPAATKNIAYTSLLSGCIGNIAATVPTYGWDDTYIYSNSPTLPGIGYSFSNEIINNKQPIGDALVRLRADTPLQNNPYYWTNYLAMNVFGDPSVSIADKGMPPEFSHPSGYHDAYMLGDLVSYKLAGDSSFRVYKSLADNNVWSPEDAPSLWSEQTSW